MKRGPSFIILSIYGCKCVRTGYIKIWITHHKISVDIRNFLQCMVLKTMGIREWFIHCNHPEYGGVLLQQVRIIVF